ncbi:hypothetical protein GWK47_010485 [Chionoecetes opilio]|uniref:Uncharacterized protein n=1 Tax=Chionoecetes opilio TaxID=41210 RepID=A0A8J5CP28_CHIOP|nr:hypothetical protein GWK47_010485 [Chionoecetes opilio]
MAHTEPVARVHVDQKAWTDWRRTEHPGNPSQVLLHVHFKLYYELKVHHRLEAAPSKHNLTLQLQSDVGRSPRRSKQLCPSTCGQEHVRTLTQHVSFLLRLMASRVRTTAACRHLISWLACQVHEPAFTCFHCRGQIQEIVVKPYEGSREFSIHLRAPKEVVNQLQRLRQKQVVGQQARDGSFIRARVPPRCTMPCFRSKTSGVQGWSFERKEFEWCEPLKLSPQTLCATSVSSATVIAQAKLWRSCEVSALALTGFGRCLHQLWRSVVFPRGRGHWSSLVGSPTWLADMQSASVNEVRRDLEMSDSDSAADWVQRPIKRRRGKMVVPVREQGSREEQEAPKMEVEQHQRQEQQAPALEEELNQRKRLYFPAGDLMTLSQKRVWAARLAVKHREFRPLLKEGVNRPLVTVEGKLRWTP